MASSIKELDKFIQKFKSLWVSGSNAKLLVQADAETGVASVSLSVDIKLEMNKNVKLAGNTHRHGASGGSPSRQRRRARREAERLAKAAAAAEAVSTTDMEVKVNNSQQTVNRGQDEMSEREFDLSFVVHESVKSYDILEAIEVNYGGSLNDRNVSLGDPCRFISFGRVKRTEIDTVENDTGEKLEKVTCRIVVKNDENVSHVINDWRKSSNFDDLAFRNAVRGQRQVLIREVKEIM